MKNLLSLAAAMLLLAFTPRLSNPVPNHSGSNLQNSFIVQSFHRDGSDVSSSDGHSYYVTLDFNLATQLFGTITAHDVLTPSNELSVTLISGAATTHNGDGSTIDITTALSLSINGTSVTLSIPTAPNIPFD